MTELIQYIQEQMQSNQFLAGGFMLGVMATMLHQLRSWPLRIWGWVHRRISIEIDIPDRDPAFIWIDRWLAKQNYSRRRARLLTVRTQKPTRIDQDGDEVAIRSQLPEIIFSPSVGRHWFFYKRRLVCLYRERKDGTESGGGGVVSFGIRESFTIRLYTLNRHIANELLEDARELIYPPGERKIGILTERYGEWSTTSHQRVRPIETVILVDGQMESLAEKVSTFLDREDWYIERGIPWRLGVLLYGPPGSGKSSTVMAIASHCGLDIALLNLNGLSTSDARLRDMLSRLPENTIVLLEDVDAIGIERKPSNKTHESVSFSGLLNAIDGVAASEGRILFMTTNYVERLDDALIRPGRVDIKVEIAAPTIDQKKRLFLRFFPDAKLGQVVEFVENCKLESMASLQGYLMNCTTVADAVSNAWKQHLP
jgi:chaperone BCS1